MRFGILNEELGIATIEGIDNIGYLQAEEMKKGLPDGVDLDTLAFFYMKDRDWIVINKKHPLVGFYSQIIPDYLELSADSRIKVREEVPNAFKGIFEMLDSVIRDRILMHGRMCCE